MDRIKSWTAFVMTSSPASPDWRLPESEREALIRWSLLLMLWMLMQPGYGSRLILNGSLAHGDKCALYHTSGRS